VSQAARGLPAVGEPRRLADGVLTLCTGRAGGVSAAPFSALNLSDGVADDPAAVAANRQLAATACGLSADDTAWMRQVHGTDVGYVTSGSATEPAGQLDAMYTDQPGLALAVLVADCAPVLLADPVAGLVGAAHAGREGMAAGVLPALITAMTAAGAEPARMAALIGPSICGHCYEVPADMRDRVGGVVPAAACLTRAGTPGLDIAAGLRSQLAAASIGRVSVDPRCTAESAELYSYRRDGTTGRFAAVVWRAP
jgi:polyphenol oxidase